MAPYRILLMASLLIFHNSSGQGSKGSGLGSTESSDEKLGAESALDEIRSRVGESGSEARTAASGWYGIGALGSNGKEEVGKVMENMGDLEQVNDGLKDLKDLKDTLKELVDIQKKAYEDTKVPSYEDLKGRKAQVESMRAKKMTESDDANDKEIFHIFEQKERDPEAALGFLRLDMDYNGDEAPNGSDSKVKAWLEPTFVTEIDSMARKMGLEMKLKLMWEDERIIWRMDENMYPGAAFHFDPSILTYV